MSGKEGIANNIPHSVAIRLGWQAEGARAIVFRLTLSPFAASSATLLYF